MGLFNTTNIVQGKTEYVPYEKEVTITEIKAPTDESIKLLNEMQDKARLNIIKTVNIEHNHLKAVVIYYRDILMENKMLFHIRFNLNGKDYILEDYIDKHEYMDEVSKTHFQIGNEAIYSFIHKRFSEVIATELLKQSNVLSNLLK